MFAKDGVNALAAIGKYVVNVPAVYLDYLDEWTLNVNGEEENCIEELKKVQIIKEKYSRKAVHARCCEK